MSMLDLAENVIGPVGQIEESDSQTPISMGPETPQSFVTQGLDFAEPHIVSSMMYQLGLDPVKLDTDSISKMKSIYELSKQQSLPLDEYLLENGRRIGGKLSPGFLGKLYVYLTAVNRENNLRKQLHFAQSERSMYEDVK